MRASTLLFTFLGALFLSQLALVPLHGAGTTETENTKEALLFQNVEGAMPPARKGGSAGKLGDHWAILGGYGLDNEPTNEIFLRAATETPSTWTKLELAQPVAWAASTPYRNGLLLVGGTDESGLTTRVTLLTYDNKKLEEQVLAELPIPLAGASAAVFDDHLYVLGGVTTLDSTKAEKSFYRLDLQAPEAQWKKLPDHPGPGRVFPTLAVFNEEVHVFGGLALVEKGGEIRAQPLADVYGYRERPLDATTAKGWIKHQDMPEALGAALAFATGHNHALVMGGINQVIPFSLTDFPPPALSPRVYVYHGVTETWLDYASLPTGLAFATHVGEDLQHGEVGEKKHYYIGHSADGKDDLQVASVTLKQTVKSLSIWDYVVIAVYLLLMVAIGAYFARKQNSSEEFALGNRKVKWWAAAISMFATGASSISFMSIPALTFRTNLVWVFPVIFLIFFYFLQAYVLFPVLRRLRLTSTYAYLEQRYHPFLRYLASLQCILLQMIGRMSVVLLLPAMAISVFTGVDVTTSVVVMGLLTTVYTALGGFEAVIWTDVTQGLLMFAGSILMAIFAIQALDGGWNEFVATNEAFDRFEFAIVSFDYSLPIIFLFFLFELIRNLSIASDQPVIQRVYSTPLSDVRKLSAMFIFWSIAIAVAVNFMGLALFAYFHAHPEELSPTMQNDQVVPLFIVQQLPVGLAGLIIACLFAASMSTLSSSMNSVATLVCEDFYSKIFKTTDRSRLVFMKVGSLLIGLFGTGVAYFMATMNLPSLFETWSVIIAYIGGGFVGMFILGIFTKRTNTGGVIIGAAASVIATIYVGEFTDLHWAFYGLASIMTCLAVGYLASLFLASFHQERDLSGLTIFDMKRELNDEEYA